MGGHGRFPLPMSITSPFPKNRHNPSCPPPEPTSTQFPNPLTTPYPPPTPSSTPRQNIHNPSPPSTHPPPSLLLPIPSRPPLISNSPLYNPNYSPHPQGIPAVVPQHSLLTSPNCAGPLTTLLVFKKGSCGWKEGSAGPVCTLRSLIFCLSFFSLKRPDPFSSSSRWLLHLIFSLSQRREALL